MAHADNKIIPMILMKHFIVKWLRKSGNNKTIKSSGLL